MTSALATVTAALPTLPPSPTDTPRAAIDDAISICAGVVSRTQHTILRRAGARKGTNR